MARSKMKLCCWKDAAAFRKSSSHNADSFQPRPSSLSKNGCRDASLPNDHDIWVEASYQSSTTGTSIPYYRSLRTGNCRKIEPPTGARRCVRRRDDNTAETEHDAARAAAKEWILRAVAEQPLSKDQIRSIPTSRPNAKVVQDVIANQARRQHRLRRRKCTTLAKF